MGLVCGLERSWFGNSSRWWTRQHGSSTATCHSDHISNALITLHWLRAQERVRFKTTVLVYKATHTAPAYLSHAWVNGSCRRSVWSALPPLCSDQSSAGAAHEAVYRWRPGLPGRRTNRLENCVTVRSMVNIARLTIWSIYCSRGGGEGRADPLIVAPFIGAA